MSQLIDATRGEVVTFGRACWLTDGQYGRSIQAGYWRNKGKRVYCLAGIDNEPDGRDRVKRRVTVLRDFTGTGASQAALDAVEVYRVNRDRGRV